MWSIGGLFGAAVAVFATWNLGGAGTANLPPSLSHSALAGLLVLAAGTGFLAGAAIVRRMAWDRASLGLFSGLSVGFAGGVIGCAYALVLTASYVSSYAVWPDDRMQQALFVLAFPVFGFLGFCLGAAIGGCIGLLAGTLLRFVPGMR